MVKKVINHAAVLLTAAWGIYIISLVLAYLTNRFLEALYSSQFSRLYLQKLFSLISARTTIALILMAFGAFCVIIYFISYEAAQFLKYAQFFLLAAPFIVTIWDYEIIFFANRELAIFWSKSGDISLILLVLVFHTIIISHLQIAYGKVIQWMEYTAACIGIISVLLLRTVQTIYALRVYLVCEAALLIIIIYLDIRRIRRIEKAILFPKSNLIVGVVLGFLQLWVLYLVSFFKFNTFSDSYEVYRNYMPIIMMCVSVVTFFYFFWYYRFQIFYGRETGKKIQEITKHKEEISRLIIHFCDYPINRLSFFCHALHSQSAENMTGEKQEEILGEMEKEVFRLRQHLINISDFHYLQGNVIYPDKIKVNLSAVLMSVSKALRQEERCGDTIQQLTEDLNIDVWGEPYSLIQANQTILGTFYGIAEEHLVRMTCERQSDCVYISISAKVSGVYQKEAGRLYRIFHNANYVRLLNQDEDIALSVAKNYLLNHDPALSAAMIKKRGMCQLEISYRLDLWEKSAGRRPEEEVKDSGPNETKEQEKFKEIVLLSNAPDQIELIRTYLMFEPYRFQFFSVVGDMLAYMEKQRDIGVLILGTIFFEKDMEYICAEIRKRYSFAQLPILFVYPEHFRGVELYLNQSINDILAEPFEQIKLLRKIKLLLLLQKSADETLKSRLNFLQAQMDPHFIFNTLSTIMPLCIQNPEKAYEVLNDFSEYLRGRLYTKELQEPIFISHEVDLIEAYLSIEKVRFPDVIQYRIVKSYTSRVMVLPLLIEPIVENCIKHGVRDNRVLHISLYLVEEDDDIYCSVVDDGKGMSPQRLLDVKQGIQEERNSIGIDNVRKRLMLYYHEELHISSTLDKGTNVSFKIPVKAPF